MAKLKHSAKKALKTPFIKREDLIHLLIILALASIVGIYLGVSATTTGFAIFR